MPSSVMSRSPCSNNNGSVVASFRLTFSVDRIHAFSRHFAQDTLRLGLDSSLREQPLGVLQFGEITSVILLGKQISDHPCNAIRKRNLPGLWQACTVIINLLYVKLYSLTTLKCNMSTAASIIRFRWLCGARVKIFTVTALSKCFF